MTVGQAVLWAATDVNPKNENPELTTSEPYVMGSHATGCGAWCSGPEDVSPPEYQWGYNRMMTIEGLFGAGDAVGGTPHAFSSGSFTEGRISAKSACKYIDDGMAEGISVSDAMINKLKEEVFRPLEHYKVHRNEIVAGTVNPNYHTPRQELDRLQKLMDEYGGGVTVNYMTNDKLLSIGLKKTSDNGRRSREDCGQGPSRIAAFLGSQASPSYVRVCSAAHTIPQGNKMAGVLLPW
jgi:adenylylsulfate reductase subunit A